MARGNGGGSGGFGGVSSVSSCKTVVYNPEWQNVSVFVIFLVIPTPAKTRDHGPTIRLEQRGQTNLEDQGDKDGLLTGLYLNPHQQAMPPQKNLRVLQKDKSYHYGGGEVQRKQETLLYPGEDVQVDRC